MVRISEKDNKHLREQAKVIYSKIKESCKSCTGGDNSTNIACLMAELLELAKESQKERLKQLEKEVLPMQEEIRIIKDFYQIS